MSKKDKKNGSFLGNLFKRTVTGNSKELNVFEEEAIKTPGQVIFSNFIHNKFSIIGIVLFVAIFSFCYVGGAFFPLKATYNEPILQNLEPGHGYLNFPAELEKEEIVNISSGITFSVANTADGDVYVWGKDIDGVMEVPNQIKGNAAVIAAGDRHIVALTKTGTQLGWGQDVRQQANMPLEAKYQIDSDEKIVKMTANDKYSAVVTDTGKLIIFGATGSNSMDFVPAAIQGNVADLDGNSYNMVLLMKDGTIGTVGVSGNEFSNVPEHLKDGSTKVVKAKMSFSNGIALDDQGKIHVWGANDYNLLKGVPQIDEKVIDIAATRNSLFAVGESGKVYAWGDNSLGELNVPENFKAEKIFASYFQVYAVSESGEIEAWGNNGYYLGTDIQGRDYLTRLMHGGRVTLVVGVIAVVIETVIGMFIGMISGFKGGRVDNLLMRFGEIISSIPFMPLVITLSASIGNNMSTDEKMYLIMVILGILSWPGMARLVRAQILIEREKDFVLAARALGIKEGSIIIRHIMPNVLNICIVNMTLSYASKMLMEAALSFLGFGVVEPMPSWGNMLNAAQSATVIQNYWWQWITPAVCVCIAALGVNLVGDALREALDPKANEK